jgi:hypothetical protein
MKTQKRIHLVSIAAVLALCAFACSFLASKGEQPQVPENQADKTENHADNTENQAEGINHFLPTATNTLPSEIPLEANGQVSFIRYGVRVDFKTGSLSYDTEGFPLSSWSNLSESPTLGYQYAIDIFAFEDVDSYTDVTPTTVDISIFFEHGGENLEFVFPFPRKENTFFPVAEFTILSLEDEVLTFYQLSSGSVSVQIISANPGEPAAVSGTFSGTFSFLDVTTGATDPTRGFEVSNGTFQVDNIPYINIYE